MLAFTPRNESYAQFLDVIIWVFHCILVIMYIIYYLSNYQLFLKVIPLIRLSNRLFSITMIIYYGLGTETLGPIMTDSRCKRT